MKGLTHEESTHTKLSTDPVCHMKVDPNVTPLKVGHGGRSYCFCAEGCRRAFLRNPGKYLKAKASKPKGWWGRYLERVARANKELFGELPPRCCH
jgi:Cu+-exporting ATPase